MSAQQVLRHLDKLGRAVNEATYELEQYLLDLTETAQWTQLSWAELASALGVSRQAVQQRVARLLANGIRERDRRLGVSPDQGTLDDLIAQASAALPPAKGRKR